MQMLIVTLRHMDVSQHALDRVQAPRADRQLDVNGLAVGAILRA